MRTQALALVLFALLSVEAFAGPGAGNGGPRPGAGAAGATGATGSGATGQTGQTGQSGKTGASGQTGTSGNTGSTGQTGPSGNDGALGLSGASGSTGVTGQSGLTGATGGTGQTGASGASGSSGASGQTGQSGASGASGSSGNTGATGTFATACVQPAWWYDFGQNSALTFLEFGGITGSVDKAAGSTINHPGIWSLTTAGASTGAAVTRYGSAVIVNTGGVITYDVIMRWPNLSDGTNTYISRAGLNDTTTGAAPANEMDFVYDQATDGNFFSMQARNSSGTVTKVVSSIAIVGNTWYHGQMVTSADGTTATGTIDGVSMGSSLGTTMPDVNDQLFPCFHITKSLGGTARTMAVDFFQMTQVLTTARCP